MAKQHLYPMNKYHSQVLGNALSAVWNTIAPDLDNPENASIRRWSSKRIIETCYDYLEMYGNDDGLADMLLVCMIEEHGLTKITNWLAKEHPLGW